MNPLERLTIIALAVLNTTVTILNTTASGAPDSQFLTAARPAFDCEFVAVWISRLSEDTTSPLNITSTKKRNVFGNIILATFVLYVVRCAPPPIGSKPPTDEAKTASAAQVEQDGWAVWNGIRDQQDELFDNCLGVYFDGGVPIEERGGYVGWQFQFRASIEGYVPG